MWDAKISPACVAMYALWGAGFLLIGLGWNEEHASVGQFGLAVVAVALALTIMRDNMRTRRMMFKLDKRRDERERDQGRGGGGGGTVTPFVRPEWQS